MRKLQNNKRDFKGIWIPAKVWLNTDLTIMEKIILLEIDSLDGPDGCYANNQHFADFCDISKSRASQIINQLEKKGYVKISIIRNENKQVVKRVINSLMYEKILGLSQEVKQGVYQKTKGVSQETKHPPLENCEYKNTSYKNTNKDNSASDEAHLIFFEEAWKKYPNKRNKGKVSNSKKKEIYKLGDEFLRAIDRYIEDVEKQREGGFKSLRYKVGSTFFNSGYIDYLDDNYKETMQLQEDNNKDSGGDLYEHLKRY